MPTPVTGTENTESSSGTVGQSGQRTVTVAAKAGGAGNCTGRTGWKGAHRGRGKLGCQGQLCCGEKDMVTVQLSCGANEKLDPGVALQLSCSVKFGIALKSLGIKLFPVGDT